VRTLKEINKARTQWQLNTYSKWKETGAKGVVIAATGVGKTRLASEYAIPSMNKKQPTFTTKVVVPKVFLKEDWTSKGGHIDSFKLENVEVWVVNSFVTQRHMCDLLVLDECHRYSNEDAKYFSTIFEVCKFKYLLALSASLSEDQKRFLKNKGVIIVETLTTKEAEIQGFVSPYSVYNFAIDLTDEDKLKAQELEDNFSHYANKLGSNSYESFDLAKNILEGGLNPRYIKNSEWVEPFAVSYARSKGWSGNSLAEGVKNYLIRNKLPRGQKGTISIWEDDESPEEFTPTKVFFYAKMYFSSMKDRIDYLHTAKNKLKVTKEILDYLDQKAIIFSQRTKFADEITEILGKDCESYHSNIASRPLKKSDGTYEVYKYGSKKGKPKIFGATSLKRNILERFSKGELKYLSTATSLDEGLDIPAISVAIIVSSTGKQRQDIQRCGRALRAEEGKFAIIVNLYVPNTQDEKWLKDRQKGGKAPIWINNVKQLNPNYGNAEFKNDDQESSDEESIIF